MKKRWILLCALMAWLVLYGIRPAMYDLGYAAGWLVHMTRAKPAPTPATVVAADPRLEPKRVRTVAVGPGDRILELPGATPAPCGTFTYLDAYGEEVDANDCDPPKAN